MITLLGALLGFLGSAFPDFMKLWRDKLDRAHELKILEMQMEQARQGHATRLEEIGATADINESRALYKTYNTGIRWVDSLNGTVRPVLAYCFFLLYASVKFLQFSLAAEPPLPWQIGQLWTQEDAAIFAGIISFYFGSRAMGKLRK